MGTVCIFLVVSVPVWVPRQTSNRWQMNSEIGPKDYHSCCHPFLKSPPLDKSSLGRYLMW